MMSACHQTPNKRPNKSSDVAIVDEMEDTED
jgi:hypothetical protein